MEEPPPPSREGLAALDAHPMALALPDRVGAPAQDVALAALASKQPFPMRTSMLHHLQQENKWQREQIATLVAKVEVSEKAALQALRSSEKAAEKQRREAAEEASSAVASKLATGMCVHECVAARAGGK
jgi:hypothetical protein